jgi:hypothetical protein
MGRGRGGTGVGCHGSSVYCSDALYMRRRTEMRKKRSRKERRKRKGRKRKEKNMENFPNMKIFREKNKR